MPPNRETAVVGKFFVGTNHKNKMSVQRKSFNEGHCVEVMSPKPLFSFLDQRYEVNRGHTHTHTVGFRGTEAGVGKKKCLQSNFYSQHEEGQRRVRLKGAKRSCRLLTTPHITWPDDL